MASIVAVMLLPVVTGFNFSRRSLPDWMFPCGGVDDGGATTDTNNPNTAFASVVTVLLVLLGSLLRTLIRPKELPVAQVYLDKRTQRT